MRSSIYFGVIAILCGDARPYFRRLTSTRSASPSRRNAQRTGEYRQTPADQISALVVAGQRWDQETPSGSGFGSQPGYWETFHPRMLACGAPSRRTVLWMTAIRRWAIKLWGDCSGRSSGVKLRSWVLAAVTLAVLTVNLLSYSFRRSAVPDHRAPNYLYLTVEQAGPALRLLWDGNSSAVRGGATRAILHIQDGDQQSERELAPSELIRAGQFTYQPPALRSHFSIECLCGRTERNWLGSGDVSAVADCGGAADRNPSRNRYKTAGRVHSLRLSPSPVPRRLRRSPHQRRSPMTGKTRTLKLNFRRSESSDASKISPPAAISPLAAREPSLPSGVEESPTHSPNAERNDISTPAGN